ncbi:MAG: VWA domain-containing protein [Planctomycetes bacterium]|nr:VWA domain-containing protein [Planctomycetota bacterium]
MLGFADQTPNSGALPEGKPPVEEGQEEPTVREEANLLLETLAPWGISILLHLGIVLLAVFMTWNSVQKLDIEIEEPIIPISTFSATPGVPMTGRMSTSTAMASTKLSRSTSTSAAALGPGKTGVAGLGGTGTGGGKGSGVGPGSGGGPGSMIIGFGTGGGGGAGGGGGSPFGTGTGGGGGGGLRVGFFGNGGNAKKIIYLIDASGSLIDTLPFVINELKRSINALSEVQSFTVIFFQGDDVKEVPPRNLKPANAETKKRVIEWIDPAAGNIIPGGGTNPVKALKLALQYQPQLIYVLSDNITGNGRFEVDQRRLLADIERANSAGTKINTIQFIYQDPLVAKNLKGTLELISTRSGGIYKFLDARELQIQ